MRTGCVESEQIAKPSRRAASRRRDGESIHRHIAHSSAAGHVHIVEISESSARRSPADRIDNETIGAEVLGIKGSAHRNLLKNFSSELKPPKIALWFAAISHAMRFRNDSSCIWDNGSEFSSRTRTFSLPLVRPLEPNKAENEINFIKN